MSGKARHAAHPSPDQMDAGYGDIPASLLQDFKPDHLQMYHSCFKMYDLNHDGLIDAKELAHVSHRLGYRMENDRIAVRNYIQRAYNKLWYQLSVLASYVLSVTYLMNDDA